MGLRDLTAVLVRLYGLLLLFYCLQTGKEVFLYKTISAPFDPILRVNFISSVTSGILYGIMGVCLLAYAKGIAGWVAPKTSDRLDITLSTADLGLVSFSLMGIFFFVDGISWFVHDGVAWHLTPKSFGSEVPMDPRWPANLAMSAVKVGAGLFLLFGSRGVLRVVRWDQVEGGYARNTVELPKVLKCPNCGAEYNPEEYNQDALEWFCPQCRKALPRE